jgi:ribosomal-protein-alanine N-acetyltransferase
MGFVIESPRLLLREMERDDAPFLAELLADEQVMKFYPRPYTNEEARGWVQRQQDRYARDGHGLWIAQKKMGAEPIGQVGLVVQEVGGEFETEVGYMLSPLHWGQGLATEAASAARDYAFSTLGKERLISIIHRDNRRSVRVAERLGMAFEKEAFKWDSWKLVYAGHRGHGKPSI